MNAKMRLLAGLGVLSLVSMVSGQDRNRGPLPLKAGDSMPAVSGYNAEGEAFPLSQLKGHYTVIAFGCLT